MDLKSIDVRTQKYISERRNPTVTQVMTGLTSLGSVPLNLILLFFIYQLGTFQQFKELLITLILTWTLVHFLKKFYSRERPENQVIDPSFASSFPSGHAATGFASSILLSTFFPGLATVFVFLALTVSFSRIYLGEHFFTDALAGSLLGIFTALIVTIIL